MNRKLLFTLLFSVMCIGALAQTPDIARQGISASGATFQQSTGFITQSIGEVITLTLTGSGQYLTQGFVQGKFVRVAVEDFPDFAMSVFPNPVNDLLVMQVDLLQDMQYTLHDVTGVLIERGLVLNERTEIDFSQLPPAVYILRVFDNNQQIRVFQIVKH